jgi:hypothetical protein
MDHGKPSAGFPLLLSRHEGAVIFEQLACLEYVKEERRTRCSKNGTGFSGCAPGRCLRSAEREGGLDRCKVLLVSHPLGRA